jgi:hypothetical protein
MDYTYDIFISYRRSRCKSEWLIEHFLPLFEEYLANEIMAQCQRLPRKIFFDQAEINPALRHFEESVNGIEPGANWRLALHDAIQQSCCMVGVWSPDYFFSEWCLAEWKTFKVRQLKTNRITVVPFSVHDGTTFPAEARGANIVDLNDYMIVGEGFRKTEQYVAFQQALKNFARNVAAIIKQSPPFESWTGPELVTPPVAPPIGLTTLAAK